MRSRNKRNLTFLLSFAVVLFNGSIGLHAVIAKTQSTDSGNTQTEIITLEPGQDREFELASDKRSVFQIPLAANQFLHVFVTQKGLDVSLFISGPHKKQVREIDGPNGLWGAETLSLIAEETGAYFLEVRPSEIGASPGKYRIRIETPNRPNQVDQDRVASTESTIEARRLRNGPKESQLLALKKYAEALRLWQNVGDREREAVTLMGIGRVHRLLGNSSSATEAFSKAQELWAQMANPYGEAQTLNEQGRAYETLGKPQIAIESYQQALQRFETLGYSSERAITLNNLGNAYNRLANIQRAVDFYQRASEIAKSAKDSLRQIQAMNGLGSTQKSLGDLYAARHTLQDALALARHLVADTLTANTLNNLGVVYDSLGYWQEALESFAEARGLARSVSAENQVIFLNNTGMLHTVLGDPEKAREYYEQAVALHKNVSQPDPRATTLSGLGYAWAKTGDWSKAKASYETTLKILSQTNNPRWKAYTLTNLGVSYAAVGDWKTALERYNQAIQIWEEPNVNDAQGRAYTLDKLAEALAASGDFAQAMTTYSETLSIWRRISDPRGEASTLLGIARAERSLGNLGKALNSGDAALRIIESQRNRASSEQFRMSYLASKQEFYEFAIDVRMRLHEKNPDGGHNAEALLISEKFRARTLIDTLANARIEIRQGIDSNLPEKQSNLEKVLADKQERRRQLNRLEKKAEVDFVTKEIVTLSATIKELETRIRSENPHYANLTQPLPISLSQIQQEVLDDDNTVLLEYMLGEEQSYLWAVSRTGKVESHVLPPRQQIEQKAREIKCLLTRSEPTGTGARLTGCVDSKETHYWTKAAELSSMILGPVARRTGNKRLLIVADGELQYLPFGALPPPTSSAPASSSLGSDIRGSKSAAEVHSPLFLKNEIVYLPSALTLAMLRRETAGRTRATKTIAILADPVFEQKDSRLLKKGPLTPGQLTVGQGSGDKRLGRNETADATTGSLASDTEPALARLLSSAQEARMIRALVPPAQRLVATGFAANRTTAVSSQLMKYRYIHFATHAIIDDRKPELSGIAFSRFEEDGRPQANNFLRLQDIYNLKLPSDLIVLSACNTALGKRVRGEGLISLTRGFMYAGAKRVVSSLWQVDDESTAELMGHFYRHMLKERMTPAAALRAAQIDLWKQSPDRPPYYWGAFIIQGEWR